MNKIVIDEPTRAKLGDLRRSFVICDQSGRTLGYFTPAEEPSMYKGVEPQISEEELQRRERSTEWYTTDEVLRHLEKL